MSDNSKFRDDLNRAKNFFEKKLKKNNFKIIKKFKFPFLTFEDRIYKKSIN